MQFGDFVGHPLHRFEDGLRPAIHPFSVLAHRHAPGGAVQQAHAEAFLQQADALADEGGGGPHFAGYGGEAGAAGHQDEDAEVFQVGQTIHSSCLIYQ
ncbi:hypothetical protein D9M71_677800 [compost metagenome]